MEWNILEESQDLFFHLELGPKITKPVTVIPIKQIK